MKYVLSIRLDERAFDSQSEPSQSPTPDELKPLGQHGDNRETSSAGVWIRHVKGIQASDPVGEPGEQLAGYFLVEARDLAEAVSIAAQIRVARGGRIQVRQLKQARFSPHEALTIT